MKKDPLLIVFEDIDGWEQHVLKTALSRAEEYEARRKKGKSTKINLYRENDVFLAGLGLTPAGKVTK